MKMIIVGMLKHGENIRVRKHPAFIEPTLPYLEVDLDKKQITEHKNPCPTKESLYALCDIDKAYSLFKDDFVLKIMLSSCKQ